MRPSRLVTIAAAAAAATLTLGSAPLAAQDAEPEETPDVSEPVAEEPEGEEPEGEEPEAPAVLPISVDPTSGPIGTTIHVSGSDCPDADVEIVLLAGTSLYEWHAIVDYVWDITTGPDGTWSGELFVYDTMFELPADPEADLVEVDVVPGGDYFVAAACLFEDSFVESDVVPFDITGDGPAPPRTDPPAVPDIGTPSAQPATSVVGDPTYTG